MSENETLILEKLDRIEKILTKKTIEQADDWVKKNTVLEMLSCSESKLYRLVMNGKILANGNPQRGRRLLYSKKSITAYKNNPDQ